MPLASYQEDIIERRDENQHSWGDGVFIQQPPYEEPVTHKHEVVAPRKLVRSPSKVPTRASRSTERAPSIASRSTKRALTIAVSEIENDQRRRQDGRKWLMAVNDHQLDTELKMFDEEFERQFK